MVDYQFDQSENKEQCSLYFLKAAYLVLYVSRERKVANSHKQEAGT